MKINPFSLTTIKLVPIANDTEDAIDFISAPTRSRISNIIRTSALTSFIVGTIVVVPEFILNNLTLPSMGIIKLALAIMFGGAALLLAEARFADVTELNFPYTVVFSVPTETPQEDEKLLWQKNDRTYLMLFGATHADRQRYMTNLRATSAA